MQVAASDEVSAFPYSATYGRTMIRKILGRQDSGAALVGRTFVVGGWVRAGREQGGGAFSFIQLNDGSTAQDLQIYMERDVAAKHGGKELLKTGAALLIEGDLRSTPEGVKQPIELVCTAIRHVGLCDAASYPVAKKGHTLEFLREKAHLRPRTNVFSAVARIRATLAQATHEFFREHGFVYVHTPIITASDCEGAGEMFQVTTLLEKAEARTCEAGGAVAAHDTLREAREAEGSAALRVRQAKDAVKSCTGDAEEKQRLQAALQVEVRNLKAAKVDIAALEDRLSYVGGIKRLPARPGGAVAASGAAIDYSDDFFGRAAYLTVSGQINGEYYACALSNIYTFGPTFRAEVSHTSRHLAEFWMIEPEMAFCTLQDNMRCAEDFVRHCCRCVLRDATTDVRALAAWKQGDKELEQRLQRVAETPFQQLTYTEAIDVLRKAVADGHTFEESKIEWGMDLGSEHEKYLCETVYKKPTILYNYPKEIKAFYMKLNDDGNTVAAMDVLMPGIGELVGGSQREDNLELLESRLAEKGIDPAPYQGYFDLRRYGNVPHSGFGVGFERLVMFATGMANIRDVIPFPRYPGNALF